MDKELVEMGLSYDRPDWRKVLSEVPWTKAKRIEPDQPQVNYPREWKR